MKKADIVVIGAGAFGLALSVILDNMGHSVTVRSGHADEIIRSRESIKLPGVKIPESILITDDYSVIRNKDIVIFAVPVAQVRKTAKSVYPFVSEKSVVVNTSKGFEADTYLRMTQVILEELKTDKIVVLSGPSHAEEVARFMPTTVCAACENKEYAEYVQSVMSSEYFRIYVSDDVKGCEIGGALKNIIALCAGICDGMGYGDNTKAALITRGIVEITRLGISLGAKEKTFSGLTGIGDLIVTCTSMHSRNRRAGILIGQGISPEEAVRRVGTVEGYFCTKAAYELSELKGVSMPITEQCYNLLYGDNDPKAAIANLMKRPKKQESEELISF